MMTKFRVFHAEDVRPKATTTEDGITTIWFEELDGSQPEDGFGITFKSVGNISEFMGMLSMLLEKHFQEIAKRGNTTE